MMRLLMIAAFGAALATPALAQHADPGPNAERQRHSTVPPGGIYYSDRSGKADPQDQSGGPRWKTNHKPKVHARHRAVAARK